MLHLILVRGMRGTPLAYEVAHMLPGYSAYLNLDEEMMTMAHIIDSKSNLKSSQDSLDRVYLDQHCDTFKIDNAFVYQILSMMFIDTDAHVYINRRGTQDG